jgi:hypoxanthine phosphoribosyltransferase
MEKKVSLLIEQDVISARIKEMAEMITKDFIDEHLLCVCVLKGAFIFMADLIKHINLPLNVDYVVASSYREHTTPSDNIKIELDLSTDIAGKNILLVEDIVDTGQTIKKLCGILEQRNPKKIKICTLVDRPDRRKITVHLDYVGFTISNKFVVGYGLDFAERYRNLPFLGVLSDVFE